MNDKQFIEFIRLYFDAHKRNQEEKEKKDRIAGRSVASIWLDEFADGCDYERLPDFGSVSECPACGENQYSIKHLSPFKHYDSTNFCMIRRCKYCQYEWKEKTINQSTKKKNEYLLLWSDGSKTSVFANSISEAKDKWMSTKVYTRYDINVVCHITTPDMKDLWLWNEVAKTWI